MIGGLQVCPSTVKEMKWRGIVTLAYDNSPSLAKTGPAFSLPSIESAHSVVLFYPSSLLNVSVNLTFLGLV